MSSVRFSVVIPAYNSSAFIEDAVNSIKKQSYDSWELIIVENGSTDNTYELASTLSDGIRIRVFQSEKGVSNARNKGIEESQGEWMVFLDADDKLLPDALKDYNEAISEESDIIVGKYEHSNLSEVSKVVNDTDVKKKEYLQECLLDPTQKCNIHGVAFRREYLDEHGIRFEADLTHAEDSEFLIHSLCNGACVVCIERKVYSITINNDSAVRSMDVSTIEKYEKSIRRIERYFTDSDSVIDNSFQVFILSQLLVVLVNSVYKNLKMSEANKMARTLCEREIFSKAITKVDLRELPFSRRLTFKLMKHENYMGLGVIIKGRAFVKKLKNRG